MKGSLRTFLLLATIALVPSTAAGEGGTLILSGAPELFLDDYLVQSSQNLERVLVPPAKHLENPLITMEYPWEKRILEIYGTVLYDISQSKFRCWYLGNEFKDGIPDTPEHPKTSEYYTCYAESEDGLHWRKPFVGREPFGLHTQHNIIIPDTHGFCVMLTPDDPDPARRYKGAGGALFGFSPDGLNWELRSWRDAIGKNDTSTCLVHWRNKYLAYVRAQVPDPNWPGVMRGIGLSTSVDFESWTPKQTIFVTDERDGYPWTQPYGISVSPYGDVLIGILWLLHLDKVPGNNRLGTMNTELVVSRDGINWQRVADRVPFLEPSADAWDRGGVFTGTSLVMKDDQIWVYYTGTSTRHGEGGGRMGIGLATLPADRFVGLQRKESSQAGILETWPLDFSGKDLLLNADTAGKNLRVELLDQKGQVIPGFSGEQCHLIPKDLLRHRVVWNSGGKEHSIGEASNDGTLRIRWILEGGVLYSFQVVP